jgi:hypothetical protein
MDTDDLSREAYKGIIIESEKISHDLTLHYGLLSYDSKDETEYIEKAEKLTRGIMKFDNFELQDFFWDNPPDKEKLKTTLERILKNIEQVKTIPFSKRKFDF